MNPTRIGDFLFVIHWRDLLDGVARYRNGEWLATWLPVELVLAQACDGAGKPYSSWWVGFYDGHAWRFTQSIFGSLEDAQRHFNETYEYQVHGLAKAQVRERAMRRAS